MRTPRQWLVSLAVGALVAGGLVACGVGGGGSGGEGAAPAEQPRAAGAPTAGSPESPESPESAIPQVTVKDVVSGDDTDVVQVVGLGAQDSFEQPQEFADRYGTKSFPMLWDPELESWRQLA